MDNDKKLFEGLLKADGIDPAGITETERQTFREMLDSEQKNLNALNWRVVGISAILSFTIPGACLLAGILGGVLGLPPVVTGIVIVSSFLTMIIILARPHNKKLRQSGEKVHRLSYLVHGKHRGFAFMFVGKKNGKRVIRWPRLIMLTITLWLFTLLVAPGVLYLFSKYWLYSQNPVFLILSHIIFPLAFVITMLVVGLKVPLDELTKIKDKPKPPKPGLHHDMWRIIMQSKITKYVMAAVILVAALFGINQFGVSIDGAAPAFASVRDSFLNQKWVYMFSEDRKSGTIQMEYWYNPKEEKVFAKSNRGPFAFMIDLKAREKTEFRSDTITISSLGNFEQTHGWLSQRLPMINGLLESHEEKGAVITKKAAKYNNKHAWLYEIELTLPDGSGKRTHQNTWLVDTKSGLPIICEYKDYLHRKGKDGYRESVVNSIRYAFDYSDFGPGDLYDLGVAKDTKVNDTRPSREIQKIIDKINAVKAKYYQSYAAIIFRDSDLPGSFVMRDGDLSRRDHLELSGNSSDIYPRKDQYLKDMGDSFESVYKWIHKPDSIIRSNSIRFHDKYFEYKTYGWDIKDGKPMGISQSSSREYRFLSYCWWGGPSGKIVEDEYSKENGLVCTQTKSGGKYYLDPKRNYLTVRGLDKKGKVSSEITEFAVTPGGMHYPRAIRTMQNKYRIYAADLNETLKPLANPKSLPNYVDYRKLTKDMAVQRQSAVDPNAPVVVEYTGFTPLHMAIYRKDIDKVKQCLRKGGEVEPDFGTGASPMELAVASGSLEMVKLLHKHGGSFINKQKESCLGLAVKNGHDDIADYIRKAKVDINVVYKGKNTPLHYAAEKGDAAKVKKLLAGRAKFNVVNKSGYTPLTAVVRKYMNEAIHYGDEKKNQKYKDTIDLLVKAGADIDFRYNKSHDGATMLQLATSSSSSGRRNAKQQVMMLKFLMDMGANPNLMRRSCSPLTIAIEARRYDLAKVLLDNGADPWTLPVTFSQGYSRLNLLHWAKARKLDETYNFLYPYMKERFEATNKTLADSAKTNIKAILSDDPKAIKSHCIDTMYNQWPKWSKTIGELYAGNEDLLNNIRVDWFTVDGTADVLIPLPKAKKSKFSRLRLFLYPDGTWKCINFRKNDGRLALDKSWISNFRNFIYDQHGLTDKLYFSGGGSSSTSKGDCVTGRLIFKAQKDGLRIDMDDNRRWKRWYVLAPEYVKCYSDKALALRGQFKFKQEDKKMEVTFEPAGCTIKRDGREYVFTVKDGKVVLDDGKKVVTADKIVVNMPEVVIELVDPKSP
ncbi:MAG: hypothetical protein FVQ82_09590 [Planctomycetes bacterium]|nr:hypothetical protein [Planctomycetota bacterium]